MTIDQVTREIDRFIRDKFAVPQNDQGYGLDVHLFDGGYVDSVGIVELLEFLDEEFQVTIPDEDLLSDDFATVQGMARIVQNLRNGAA